MGNGAPFLMRKRKNNRPEPYHPASHLPDEKFPSAAGQASFASSLPFLLGSLLLLLSTTGSAQVYHAIYDGMPNPKNPHLYEMPAWRPLFNSVCVVPPNCRAEIQMRVANLTSYIQSLQEK